MENFCSQLLTVHIPQDSLLLRTWRHPWHSRTCCFSTLYICSPRNPSMRDLNCSSLWKARLPGYMCNEIRKGKNAISAGYEEKIPTAFDSCMSYSGGQAHFLVFSTIIEKLTKETEKGPTFGSDSFEKHGVVDKNRCMSRLRIFMNGFASWRSSCSASWNRSL